MSMWNVREQSLAAINSNLKRENEAMEEIFTLIGKYARRFQRYAVNDKKNERFAITCCHMLIKAHHFAHGTYSLLLDGLVVEAGALLRSLTETTQYITYLSEYPERVEEFDADNLPKVGDIARKINPSTQEEKVIQEIWRKMRTNYNKYCSHFNMQEETLRPLILSYDESDLVYGIAIDFYSSLVHYSSGTTVHVSR